MDALTGYYVKLLQLGADPDAYPAFQPGRDRWIDDEAFRGAVRNIPVSSLEGGEFEELQVFDVPEQYEDRDGSPVVCMVGKPDWVATQAGDAEDGAASPRPARRFDIFEFKTVEFLSDDHRLQTAEYACVECLKLQRPVSACLLNTTTGLFVETVVESVEKAR
eukprot:2858793-Pleurochrysis_carterae.AAC.1